MRARVIAFGEWLFRQRSWTPIPVLLLLIVCTAHQSPARFAWIAGLLALGLGEGLRLWGVAVIGKESRTRGSGVEKLATEGLYAHVRNPLYLGNLCLTIGAALLARLVWMVPVVILLFFLQYIPVVCWEEHVLTERFGAAYAAYCQRVPRWVPTWRQPPVAHQPVSYHWRAALWSERSTFGSLAFLVIAMLIKQYLTQLPAPSYRQPTSARPVQSVGP